MRKQASLIFITLLTIIACTNQTGTTPSFVGAPNSASSTTPEPDSFPTFTETGPDESSTTVAPAMRAPDATLESLVQILPEVGSHWDTTSVSPNGAWVAYQLSEENKNILKIINVQNKNYWDVDFYEIYGKQHQFTDQTMGLVNIALWTGDGNHVYLEPRAAGGGPETWFGPGTSLIRFNLTDATWVDLNTGNSWAFSSDENYLVYSAADGVHLRLLSTDLENIFPVPDRFEIFGRFIWSPDNNKFAFTAAYGEWYKGNTGFSAFLVDVKNASIVMLFEDEMRMLYPTRWIDADKIVFSQYLYSEDQRSMAEYYREYYFDLVTKEIYPY